MKMGWFLLAFISLFLFAGVTLVQKHLLNLGIHPITFGLYLMAFAFIGFFINSDSNQTKYYSSKHLDYLSYSCRSSCSFGNLAATYSFKLAENPGYTQAIISASGIVILFASIFYLNQN